MDGTLVDSLMLWDVLWVAFGEKYLHNENFSPSAQDNKKVRTLTLKDAMNLIHNNYNLGESGEELLTLANCIMADFYANAVELKPGVKEFLEYCKNAGVKMCLATATAPELVDLAIKHCDIQQYFMKIISCSDLGKGKEEPDVFYAALQYLGTKKEETYVFEDSVVALTTAADAGFLTVGVYDKYGYHHEKLKDRATYYIDKEETLMKLIGD